MERSHPKPIELTTDQQLGRLVDSGEPVELYMRQAATTELLSKDEEVILFKKIEAGNEASKKLAENDFSDRHRQNFIEKVNEGHSAKNHVVQANTRLVISIAKKYQHRGLPLLDLIQAGNEGLMRSIGKFEYSL